MDDKTERSWRYQNRQQKMLEEENRRLLQKVRLYQRQKEEEAARRREIDQNQRRINEMLQRISQSSLDLNRFNSPPRQTSGARGMDFSLRSPQEGEQSNSVLRHNSPDRLSGFDLNNRDMEIKEDKTENLTQDITNYKGIELIRDTQGKDEVKDSIYEKETE